MSARDELLNGGRLGSAGAELLYRTVWSVAVGHGFPPPDGSTKWDRDAVTDTAHEFVQGDRGRRRMLDIAVRSVDEPSFARLLDAAVLNFLRDIARSTDMGKLIVRVKEILRADDTFERVPGSSEEWTLTGQVATPGTAIPSQLTAALAGILVSVPRWTSTRRDSPLADRASFIRLMRAALTAAGGSLTAVEIAQALTTRLDHRRTPLTIPLDVLEHVSERTRAGDNPADRTVAALHARGIFDTLSDRERLLVPHLDRNVRELASLIDTGKSQAALIRQRLLDRLRRDLDADGDADDTAGILCELCNAWIERRTGRRGCDV